MPVGSYEGRGVSSVLDLGKRKQKETTITYHLSSEGHSWESHAERSTKEEGIEMEMEERMILAWRLVMKGPAPGERSLLLTTRFGGS